MIGHKNIGLLFIMRRFVYFFMENKDQKKPTICPKSAQPHHHVATFYSSKETGDDNKWEYEQHDCYKSDEGVEAVYSV